MGSPLVRQIHFLGAHLPVCQFRPNAHGDDDEELVVSDDSVRCQWNAKLESFVPCQTRKHVIILLKKLYYLMYLMICDIRWKLIECRANNFGK